MLYAIKREEVNLEELTDEPIASLEELYRKGNKWVKEDEEALKLAREELVKLQNGDEENFKLWQKIRDLSMDSFEEVYQLLEVSFDHANGESFYRDKKYKKFTNLWKVMEFAKKTTGHWWFFIPNTSVSAKQPFIVRKSDGASNYATTDLATFAYRSDEWKCERIIYVTDGRQRDHFEQLFLTAENGLQRKTKRHPPYPMFGLAQYWERITKPSKPEMGSRSN